MVASSDINNSYHFWLLDPGDTGRVVRRVDEMKEFKTVNEAIDWCETFGEWCGTVTVKLAVLGGRTWIPMEIEKGARTY